MAAGRKLEKLQSEDWSYQSNEVPEDKGDKKVDKCTSFHSRECTPIPIDLVYTWVNGTDVSLQSDLMVAKEQLDAEQALLSVKPECPLSQCIVAPMVALNPGLPANMTTRELPSVLPSFSPAKALLQFTKPLQPSNTVSVVVFHSRADAEEALTGTLKIEKISISKCYVTTDKEAPGLIQMENLAYLTGFPQSYKVSEMLRGKLSATVKSRITAFELYPGAGIALLYLKTPQDFIFLLQLAKSSRLKLDGKKLTISPVYLFWDMRAITEFSQKRPAPPKKETRDSLTANRFEENGALLYSLRSMEKHAPWVRHVYIVTNGQIPSWLNLQNPRVSIVTHKEIFLNMSHLPNFNSHAIESHLHRIPGISQKFLYLNDDMMFGKDAWLDDFYTPTDGQKVMKIDESTLSIKRISINFDNSFSNQHNRPLTSLQVYLAWPLGACSKGCPGNWINNGLCNEQCNNAACQWDGGDCKGRNLRSIRSARDSDPSQAKKTQATSQKSSVTQKPPSFFSNENENRDPHIQSKQHGEKKQINTEMVDWKAPLGMNVQQFVASFKGFLKSFQELLEEDVHLQRALMYETNGAMIGRKLQDTFTAILHRVNRLYNLKFGGMIRKVISHAPYMIDKLVMQELQDTFPQEFYETSSHHLRHRQDMQYAFSYFYFLMSVKQQANISKVFDAADKDHSGVLSESEIEALAVKIYQQPLEPEDLTSLENQLINCSKSLPNDVRELEPSQEVYRDQKMSQVTKKLIMNCKPIIDRIRSTFPDQKKYKYQIMGEDQVHFKMLHNNLAEADRIFDDIRKRPRKFICINDDLDHTQSRAQEVKKKLAIFYQSMFPRPSQFELPKGTSNKFLHMDEHL
ncbi:LOW QUALITY PROTEIN: N-acetylglucosamine-1-phosphotransferase subunits alpha/beta-like [Hippocampus comes]|uniref:LOW QUALITY PROTEIN: N-acetylglucosamine-1-phosphotransferase subunits alpha/beta-like n=1 Tax=Hippocampus comes TaxID=109280 RepID=UPI00094E510E|nr:PREDICTED: LOW QUALITY PROTEIN: N-acetylglucosamine-1-phosphotransferase subunits alpha/beta-like [Hippocampus comes]